MNIDFHPEGLTPEEEVRAWLGPFGTEASEEAVAAIVAAWERIEEVYPDLVGEDGVVEPSPGRQTAGSGASPPSQVIRHRTREGPGGPDTSRARSIRGVRTL